MFRKFLMSTAAVVALGGTAFAADLPSRAEPPVYIPPPAIFTWTGIYIGGQVGYQWGTSATQAYSLATGVLGAVQNNYSPDGVVGGAHLGYNYQFSQFVVGLEGDIEGSSYNGSGPSLSGAYTFTTREPVEGSIRGRVGVAWDRALVYATGGAAFGDFRHTYTGPLGFDSLSTTRIGWTVGGGVEYAVTNDWSVRAEYRYTDFGYFNDPLLNSSGGLIGDRKHETDNAVRVGFSYKFGEPPPAPVIAKY
ncbi:MAG: outer membrane protein [Beijerinckiaceae bacterium]